MKRCIKTDVMFLMMDVLTGKRELAMEAAKQMISIPSELEPNALTKIVDDSDYRLWSKIAACYVLGFIPVSEASQHQMVLRRAVADRSRRIAIRTHAAEALGVLRDEDSWKILRDRLLDPTESRNVRKWCIYALSELKGSQAAKVLQDFAKTHPQGVLAQELELVAR
jgi:HEAT repeat protein